jgi:hypothetical protein
MCVQDARKLMSINLTFGLCMADYVRHGRTKIISAKPTASELTREVLSG